MDCLWWHVIIHMSWFPILQKIAYARAGFQCFTCKLLRLYKLQTIQTTPYAGAGSQRLQHKSLHGAGSQQFQSFLMLVLASDNSHTNPDACVGSRQFKQFLTPGQASDSSHANPFACAGSNIAKNSLRLCRLPTIHMQILMLVKVPTNSNNSLNQGRLPTIYMRILMLVQVLTMLEIPYACAGFQQFTCKPLLL
ncbi:hypothetical protein O181_071564 [Austropuccinia psidii MF-1]|uniref:Uncharacterized protein n=1 Tax=Austropuccinia psidii MF-1 TaxID=1389203 RepID=A0A9Q3IAM1_9BASI|nr:hypothetical protein [Austropuccinia psidii MF-1]